MAAKMDTQKRSNIFSFLGEVKGELMKVHWPNAKELRKYTIVVLLVSIFMGFLIWLLDSGLGFGLHKLFAK